MVIVSIAGVAAGLVPAQTVAATHLIGDVAGAAFTYTRANSQPCVFCNLSTAKRNIAIWPTGTATFGVRNTSSVWVSAWGNGRTYSVSVDSGPAVGHATSSCSCWEADPVASGLASASSHTIVLTNTTPPSITPPAGPTGSILVQAWLADPPGRFQELYWPYNATNPVLKYSSVNFVPDPNAASGTLAMVPASGVATFWARNAAAIHLRVLENGATVQVAQAGKAFSPTFAIPDTGKYRRALRVGWGMPPGVMKITARVVSGTLALDQILVSQAQGKGTASIVSKATARQFAILTAFGDSITVGYSTLGPGATSDGYADRLTALIEDNLADVAVGGTTATCYGLGHTGDVVATAPQRVIVAFGVNDMLGTNSCHPTIDTFRSAMQTIAQRLTAAMPGVPIYIGAILPTPRATDATRAQWNEVLHDVADTFGLLYVDPATGLDEAVDYADNLHPNNGGAAIVAANWAAVVPSGKPDLWVTAAPPAFHGSRRSEVWYALQVANGSAASAFGVTLTQTLPPGATFLSASGPADCRGHGSTIRCMFQALGPGTSQMIAIRVRVRKPDQALGSISVSGWQPDPDTSDNVSTIPL